MSDTWRTVFLLLARRHPSTVGYFRMKNGAEFYLAIPDERDVLDDTFSSKVEFPFTFGEIDSLRIPERVSNIPMAPDLDAIAEGLKTIGGVTCYKADSALMIRPAALGS